MLVVLELSLGTTTATAPPRSLLEFEIQFPSSAGSISNWTCSFWNFLKFDGNLGEAYMYIVMDPVFNVIYLGVSQDRT